MITVEPLSIREIRATYPLMRETAPGLGLAEWTRFARRMADPARAHRSGIMVARIGEHSIPVGLYVWHVQRELGLGRVLLAEKVVAFDLTDRRVVAEALIASLDALAQRLGCATVKTVVHGKSSGVAPSFLDAGHHQDASVLLKRAETLTEAVG